MKKIIEFIKKPRLTMWVSVGCLSFGFLIGFGKHLFDLQCSQNEKKAACEDAFDVLCVQVHACNGNPVSECDKMFKEKQSCSAKLPDSQIIHHCKKELRNIECSDDLPASCSIFME